MPRLAVLLKGYPRLSESFVAQEILALQERGLDLLLVSLRPGYQGARHDLHERITAPVVYLPPYLRREPARIGRAVRKAKALPGFDATRRRWLADLRRDPSPSRVRRFGQACVLATEIGGFDALYAHFLHTPASVARYTAGLTGLPYAISAHAKDIWTTPDWDKREKLLDCGWLTTCTAYGAEHLRALAPGADVRLMYHGLDPARFSRFARAPGPDGSDPARPVRLLTVARAVPKKGIDVLLRALALLPPDLHWRLEQIGAGVEADKLQALARRLGVADRVTWRGALPFAAVRDAYRAADLFVLASKIAASGDRDGLPNVLMEALSQDCAAVATDVAAIPELIEDGVHGRLVPPDDPPVLAEAIAALIRDPAARLRLGAAGRERVLSDFTLERNVGRIAEGLRALSAGPRARAA